MTIETKKYARKAFYVDAIQVTKENIAGVAEWCMGTVEGEGDDLHVKVRVHRPMTERQSKAYVGDWVLYAATGYKVYTPKAFEKSFELVKSLTYEQAREAGVKPPIEERKRPPVNAVPKDPKKIKDATISSASIVAEEPNPAAGVHPIQVVAGPAEVVKDGESQLLGTGDTVELSEEEKGEQIDPQIQALLDEAEGKDA